MVVILKPLMEKRDAERVTMILKSHGLKIRAIESEEGIILGVAGDSRLTMGDIAALPEVEQVIPVSKPYKLASRETQSMDTIVTVGNVKIGGARIVVITGPCSVESREQICEIARVARDAGAVMLRGGAFKPRTSPYSFQGLGESGLRYLKEAGDMVGLPVVSEIVSGDHVDLMREYVDVFQIGARNMQNFELLKKVGAAGGVVMLKRGPAATIEEWLMAAEYLLAHDARHVILCERGIRTFEPHTRFSLDISSIPVLKELTHLPVLVDPSHAIGIRDHVSAGALAAVAAGADGIIVETHCDPSQALSDGAQSLYPQQFERLMRDIEALMPAVQKELVRLPRMSDSRPEFFGMRPVGEASSRFSVAFQGKRGAYSETAVRRFFQSDEVDAVEHDSFSDVFESVLRGKYQYGIVPLENSLAGSVHENYDLFLQYPDVNICGEIKIRIVHSLIGLQEASIDSITHVFSHPQGLLQCAKFLDTHPEWIRMPYYDTAGSVEHIDKLGDLGNAAIAGAESCAIYGLKILREGIETNPNNYTRFVILARSEHAKIELPTKGAVVFAVPDRSGALLKGMRILADHRLNLTKIESRPIMGKPWRYMFYVDIDIPDPPDRFFEALDELREQTDSFRILGLYHTR